MTTAPATLSTPAGTPGTPHETTTAVPPSTRGSLGAVSTAAAGAVSTLAAMTDTPELVTGPTDALPELLTIAEAEQRWHVSARTLRRRIDAGDIPGARKLSLPAGETWHLPALEVDALGYPRRSLPGVEVERHGAPEVLAELAAVVERTQRMVEHANEQRLEAATQAATLAERVAQLEARLAETDERLTAERDALAAELAEARKPRRWWRR